MKFIRGHGSRSTALPEMRGLRRTFAGPARDVVLAAVGVLALFALPPVFRLARHLASPETFVLRDVSTLALVAPAPPDPPPTTEPEPVVDYPSEPMPLVMPSSSVASAPPPPLLADWSPPLPSLFGDTLVPFPVGEWAPQELVFEQEEVDVPPRPLLQPPPRYPGGAMRAGVEGQVEIEAVVLADGRVDRIRVLQETPPSVFSQAARAAVERWRFEPARHRGQAVHARIRVTLAFQLDR